MISSYPKVFNLGHRAIENLFEDPVLVEEKVDGSQFSFMKDSEGNLHFRSHHKPLEDGASDKMFRKGMDIVKELQFDLHEGWIYRGEYLEKPKHNTLSYDRVPENHIVLFDIETDLQVFLDPVSKREEGNRIGLEVVPSFEIRKIISAEEVKDLLENISFLGGSKVEGIVFKNYDKISPLTGHVLMGKFVSEKFKELNRTDWKERNPGGKDIIQKISDSLRTEARWEKAIIHLKERGELENEPKDIGPLLKEINKDVLEECREEILEELFKWSWKNISRGIIRGFPEWYKERLLEESFQKNL
jgi:hypothetical protein